MFVFPLFLLPFLSFFFLFSLANSLIRVPGFRSSYLPLFFIEQLRRARSNRKGEQWRKRGERIEKSGNDARPKGKAKEKNVFVSRVWERTRAILGVEKPNRAMAVIIDLEASLHFASGRALTGSVQVRRQRLCDGERGIVTVTTTTATATATAAASTTTFTATAIIATAIATTALVTSIVPRRVICCRAIRIFDVIIVYLTSTSCVINSSVTR